MSTAELIWRLGIIGLTGCAIILVALISDALPDPS